MCSPDAEDKTFIAIMLVEMPAFARTACAVLINPESWPWLDETICT